MFKSLQSKKRHRTRRSRLSEPPSPWRVVLHQEGAIRIEIERPPMIAMLRDMLRERVFVGAALAMLFVTTVSVMLYARQARAEAFLHPQACLGGWDNPAAAAGWPDVEGGDVHTYSGTNAASVSDTLAEIFCGGFSGDMPLDTKPTALRIEFSWAYVSRQSALQVSTAPVDLATSTSAVLDAAPESVGIATSSESEAASDTAPTEPIPSKATTEASNASSESSTPGDDSVLTSSPSTEIVTPENTTPPQDASATEAPPSPAENLVPAPPAPAQETPPPSDLPAASEPSTIQGLMKWLLPRIAYAQEDAATTTATTSVQSEISTSTVSIVQDTVLEISYTLDGSTWHVLGTVTKDTFDTRSFAIPLDGIGQWSDLSKLQISVRSLSGLGLGDTVYLDGMSLGVVYEDLPQVPDESVQSTATTSGESNAAAVSSAISAVTVPSWVEASTTSTSTPIQTHVALTNTHSSADAAIDDMSADESVSNESVTQNIVPETPQAPPVSVRKYKKAIVPDIEAAHSCAAETFRVDVSGKDSARARVIFFKGADVAHEVEIGGLPDGIDVRFAKTHTYTYQPGSGEMAVDLIVERDARAQKGNFTVPIIYTPQGLPNSSTVCQINVINL